VPIQRHRQLALSSHTQERYHLCSHMYGGISTPFSPFVHDERLVMISSKKGLWFDTTRPTDLFIEPSLPLPTPIDLGLPDAAVPQARQPIHWSKEVGVL